MDEHNKADKALREREKELKIKSTSLEEVNTALRVLLKRRDEDKTEIEDKVIFNVTELVLPFLEKLKKTKLDQKQLAYLQILQSNLTDITSPFSRRLSSRFISLTPTQIVVANLIKAGKSSKEIAELMNLSSRTIDSYRESIRKKMNIKNKKANLRSHLFGVR